MPNNPRLKARPARILILVIALIVTACGDASVSNPYRYAIYNAGEKIAKCESIDEDKRIGYNCITWNYPQKLSEYHLSQFESWGEIEVSDE